jgi:hypothetical protein
MAPELLFTCPVTGQRTPTGIQINVETLSAAWTTKVKVPCLRCGEFHEIAVRELFVESALADAAERQTA